MFSGYAASVSGIDDILACLRLTTDSDGGRHATSLDEGHGVVFGGQILAQSVVAATEAVTGKEVSTLHQVFARGASPAAPLDLTVDVVHEGRGFATVTVGMGQGGRACATATALLHVPDADLIRHQPPMPDAGTPDDWPTRNPGSWWEVRIATDGDFADPEQTGPAELPVWVRVPGAPDDPTLNQALLAYVTDGFLIGTAMRPHPGIGQAQAHRTVATTVLAHTITFHEPLSIGDWVLLAHESPYAGRGRAYGRAHAFTADGRCVASFTQTAMIRDMPGGGAATG